MGAAITFREQGVGVWRAACAASCWGISPLLSQVPSCGSCAFTPWRLPIFQLLTRPWPSKEQVVIEIVTPGTSGASGLPFLHLPVASVSPASAGSDLFMTALLSEHPRILATRDQFFSSPHLSPSCLVGRLFGEIRKWKRHPRSLPLGTVGQDDQTLAGVFGCMFFFFFWWVVFCIVITIVRVFSPCYSGPVDGSFQEGEKSRKRVRASTFYFYDKHVSFR